MISKDEFHNELNALKTQFDALDPVLELTVKDASMDVEGFVVVWNTSICKDGPLDNSGNGCGKGGTRIMPGLTLYDVKRLARAMAEKNAAAGLPLGGAKSGLNTAPNAPDYEIKWKRFVQLVKDEGVLTEDGGVFGGFGYDIGGKPPLNALWTIEQLGSGKSFTGKPLDQGGTDYDKIGIAGLGVAEAGKTIIDLKSNISEPTFSVQGLGAMGGAVAKYFAKNGGLLKSVSDIKYGGTWVFHEHASDQFINELSIEILEKEATHISDDPSGALYQEVDITFPCALEDAITKENAHMIKAKFISEGANNPTTDEAHEILFKNNISVVPDIIANPGGVIAAFVEMTSTATNKSVEAIAMTKQRIRENTKRLVELSSVTDARPDLIADYMTYKNLFKQ